MTEEEKKAYQEQMEEIKEELKKQGNTMEYIEKELEGLKLDSELKEMLKDCAQNEGSNTENYKKFFSSLEKKN